jgi:hypothetical protein
MSQELLMGAQYSVFVNAGAVVLLSSALLEQERQDVLNSVLFAQLVANKKYPEFTLGDGWYDTCQGVLKDSWLQRAVAWDSFGTDAESKRAMVQWVESRLEDQAGNITIAGIAGVFNDIAQLPCNHPATELLREQMSRQKNIEVSGTPAEAVSDVRLQIIVVGQGAVMSSLFIEFETNVHTLTDPLGHLFSSDNVLGNIRLRWFQANLSSVLYVSLRDAIVKKLGDKAAKNILYISDIKPVGLPSTAGAPS